MTVVARDAIKADDIRFVLRSQTRREHENLDSHPAFAAMTNGTLSLRHYRGIMLALHDVYRSLDPAISEACDVVHADSLGFIYAPRAAILAGDLARLDLIETDLAATLPIAAGLDIPSAPALGGVLYVIEGSVLGGAMLHRSTKALLGDGQDRGNAYWAWCSSEGGRRWAMTCRLLARLDTGPSARATMVDHARLAFETIAHAFAPLERAMAPERAAC